MSNIVPTARYYPKLSEVITVDDLPEFLSFVQDGLNAIFDKIHYKNLQYSKSKNGDSAFYSLEIVSRRLAVPLPFDMALLLNPDLTGHDASISSFPVTLEYQWEILAFLKSFNLQEFSFSLDDFYDLGLKVFRITDDQVMAHIINYFVVPIDSQTTKFQQFVTDFNAFKAISYPSAPDLLLPASPSIESLIQGIKDLQINDKKLSMLLFGIYILDSDLDVTKNKLQQFYNSIVPEGIEAYIKKLIIPKAKATLALSAAIAFPRNILKPVTSNGTDVPGTTTDPTPKAKFVFAQAQLYADTEAGIGYQLELGGSLSPSSFVAIGNSGILLEIDTLKIDLSKKTNIPEATADGRPDDFIGVYARALSVTLPSRWFHDEALQGTPSTTLRIGGHDVLIGTGGLSGTILLETVPATVASGPIYYFENKFEIHFPVTVFQKNATTNVVEEVIVQNIVELKTKLYPTGAVNIPPCPIKFPITVSEPNLATGEIKTFTSVSEYQLYLNSLGSHDPVTTVPTLWKKIGTKPDKSFRIGFNKFDIVFKQNKVVSSDIQAKLEIEKFKTPTGAPLMIDIKGHLGDNGDFNLTASANPICEAHLFDFVNIKFLTLELGRKNEDFYIGTSVKLGFKTGIMADLMHGKEIEIPKLRFYGSGKFEIVGGNSFIPVSFTLPLGPADFSVTGIHLGSMQKEHNGVMRSYNYVGFDGSLSVDPMGKVASGDGIKYYYTTDNDLHGGEGDHFLHIQTITIDLTISAESKAVILHGMITIPDPGASQEYQGEVTLKMENPAISGKASISLNPKYPAFLVDASITLPKPIPMGSIAIYGFKGLLGYRYVAEKKAIFPDHPESHTWYEYYTYPERGLNQPGHPKFSKPEQTSDYQVPISLGFGASFGTSFDSGTSLSMQAMALLSIPSMFMIDAGLTIISKRLKLAEEDPRNPPFFAFFIIGDHSMELGAGANFKLPSKTGAIFQLEATLEAGFYFNNQLPWHIYLGTEEKRVTGTLFKDAINLVSESYLMISASGIKAGSNTHFEINGGIFRLWAYLEVGGQISFHRPQIGGYIHAGGGIIIDLWIASVGAEIDAFFSVEVPKPFLIYARLHFDFQFRIGCRWFHITIHIPVNITIKWERNGEVVVDAIPAIPYLNLPEDEVNMQQDRTKELVKGVHMLTNETFELNFIDVKFNSPAFVPNHNLIDKVIPLDTFIDFKTVKGLKPNNVSNKIGGWTGAADNTSDLIPPEKMQPGGNTIRQVTHNYSIEDIEIKAWNGQSWMDYNPFKALLKPADLAQLQGMDLKIGQWQRSGNQYDAIRILATNPFSYIDSGEPGWFTPEHYGITPSELYCVTTPKAMTCANVLNKVLGTKYYKPTQYIADYINGAYFYIDGASSLDENGTIVGDYAYVSNDSNPHHFAQSLTFKNYNPLTILLPEASVKVDLRLTTYAQGITISYYKEAVSTGFEPAYELIGIPVYKTSQDLLDVISYNNTTDKVVKVVIQPDVNDTVEINSIRNQIEQLLNDAYTNNTETTTVSTLQGESLEKYNSLLHKLEELNRTACGDKVCEKNTKLCDFYVSVKQKFEACLDSKIEDKSECVKMLIDAVNQFSLNFEDFDLIKALQPEFDNLKNYHSTVIRYSLQGYIDRANELLNKLYAIGNCNCGCKDKDARLCELYQTELSLFNDCFVFPVSSIDFIKHELECYQKFLNTIVVFDGQNLTYQLVKNYLQPEFTKYKELLEQLKVGEIDDAQFIAAYTDLRINALSILNKLNALGHCSCVDEGSVCTTSFHQICFLTVSDYNYNQTIPGVQAVTEDREAMTEAINRIGQPIWRPDTTYYIRFKVKDEVNYQGQVNQGIYDYYYGFKTRGPVGHFHRQVPNYIQDIQNSQSGQNLPIPVTDNDYDKYPIASLRQYIDYERSYPDAGGNLAQAKPLFFGHDQCKLSLYFIKPFVYYLVNAWNEYKNNPSDTIFLPEIKGELHYAIKDPITDVVIPYPLPSVFTNDTVPGATTSWESVIDSRLPLSIKMLNNFINHVNANPMSATTCGITLGAPLSPETHISTVTLENLKPQKLYTAIVYNAYDANGDGFLTPELNANGVIVYNDNQEVHRFVFQTSRYENFRDQVESYLVSTPDVVDATGTPEVRKAIYDISLNLSATQLTNLFALVSAGVATPDVIALETQFLHPFDRAIEGVLGLTPLNPSNTTEFNKIIDEATGNVIALLIRNPEPFNIPRIPVQDIADTILVIDHQGNVDTSYHMLHSKDYSQVLIMNPDKNITASSLNFKFKYKTWNGSAYVVNSNAISIVDVNTILIN